MSENRASSESVRASVEQRRGVLQLSLLEPRPPFAGESPELELLRAGCPGERAGLGELGGGGCELVPLAQCLSARELRFPAVALARGHAGEEEVGVDAEALREPGHGVRRGPGLPALDLAEVLLAEPAAGELGLRQTGGRSEVAQAASELDCHGSLFSFVTVLPAPHVREATVAQSASLCYLTVLDRSVMVVPDPPHKARSPRRTRPSRRVEPPGAQVRWRGNGKTPGRRSRGFLPSMELSSRPR